MIYKNYNSLNIRIERGVAFVTIDHPPINLLDELLLNELERFNNDVRRDESVRVIVFDSADPDFFIPHYNIEQILRFSDHLRDRFSALPSKAATLNSSNMLFERYRTLPKVTIARIDGRVGGGGCEFVTVLDMRFATIEKAVFEQPEVGLGIIPGAGGTQHIPRLVGRSRALEIILGCQDFNAELAERYGWINRALPSSEIGPFIERLAYRIASFPVEAIRLAKESVANSELPLYDGLREESHLFNQLLVNDPKAKQRMRMFLESGGQMRQAEKDIERILEEL